MRFATGVNASGGSLLRKRSNQGPKCSQRAFRIPEVPELQNSVPRPPQRPGATRNSSKTGNLLPRRFANLTVRIMQRRVVAAFALAPLVCPVAFFLLTVAIPNPQTVLTAGAWWWLLVLCINALPIAYLTELVLGLPTWIVFRHYGVRSLAAYAAGGAMIGWLLDLALTALAGRPIATTVNPFSEEWLRFDFCYVASASACAMLFRAILFSGPTPMTLELPHSSPR
jgi:hypothetical protein